MSSERSFNNDDSYLLDRRASSSPQPTASGRVSLVIHPSRIIPFLVIDEVQPLHIIGNISQDDTTPRNTSIANGGVVWNGLGYRQPSRVISRFSWNGE